MRSLFLLLLWFFASTFAGRFTNASINSVQTVWLWANNIYLQPYRHVNVFRAPLAGYLSYGTEWIMIKQCHFSSLSACYLLLKCFVLEHQWQPFCFFFFFPSVPTPSRPLFTRGIIKHMAAMCLQCQIVRKEWVQCLSGEIAANWPLWLSAIRGHGALDNKCTPHNSGNSATLPAPRLWFQLTRIELGVPLAKKKHLHLQSIYLDSLKSVFHFSRTERVTSVFHHSLIMANFISRF